MHRPRESEAMCAVGLFLLNWNSFILPGEVSERFKEHAWKACVGEILPWVQIPPSPPKFPFRFQSVQRRALSVYFSRPLRIEERHGILQPSALHSRLCLLLALTHPRSVVLLSDLDARMAEQDRDAFERHAGEQQLHRKRAVETVRVAIYQLRILEDSL